MKNPMLRRLILVSCMLSASHSFAAAYIKFDGVDGESKSQPPSTTRKIDSAPSPQPVALLLPAVQQVREAKAQAAATRRGNVETTWKVEKGEK